MSNPISRGVLIKNAIANIASGISGALLAVILPPLLLKQLPSDVYSIWVIILQVGAYTSLLNFGLQVAVGRFLAQYEAKGDNQSRDSMLSTAWAGLCIAGGIGILGMAVVAYFFPLIFPTIPGFLHSQSRIAMAFVGFSLACGLPFTVFMGVFIGRQKYEIPALTQIFSRVLTGFALVWIAYHKGDLLRMAQAYASINFMTYLLQFILYRILRGGCQISPSRIARAAAKELWDFCLSLSVWNIAMLMISGLDLVIVGRLDFKAVPAYAIATSLVTLVAGLQNAVFSALVPAGAILAARDDSHRLKRLLLKATRYGTLILMLSSIPLFFGGEEILRHYIGPRWTPGTLPLLRILIIGNLLRLTAAPYAALLIATGQQRLVLMTPLLEGFINLALSLVLGFRIGASGVAIGTIIGASVGLFCHIFYNLPRTKFISMDSRDFAFQGILKPMVVSLPFITVSALGCHWDWSTIQATLAYGGAALAALALAWVVVLSDGERQSLVSHARARPRN